MTEPRIDLFLFDIAGTTVADDGRVLRAFETVAAGAGLEADPTWLTARMGWFKQRVFEALLIDAGRDSRDARALAAEFETTIAADYRTRPPRPLPGATESISRFEKASIRVGFTTGFTRTIADLAIAQSGVMPNGRAPDVVVASDEVDNGRPAPDLILEAMRRLDIADPVRVGVAGDTPADLEAGSAAGCGIVVGVGHGTHTLDQLAAAPHTALLDDLHGLPALVPGLQDAR